MSLLQQFWRRLRRKSTLTKTIASRQLALIPLEAREVPTVGGGFTDGGALAEYFDNTSLSGAPDFTRREVRIDHDWSWGAPGGSTSPDFRRVGSDNFSVRWTGTIIPRFSETYTFRIGSDDGVRAWIRPAGTSNWTLLADNWDHHAYEEVSRTYAMTAGRKYDFRMEYFEGVGAATVNLRWSSPSVPEEVIEPAVAIGINTAAYDQQLYADATRMGRAEWGDVRDYFGYAKVPTDADGWPTTDAGHIFWEGQDAGETTGTYTLRFRGKAEVRVQAGEARLRVGNADYGRVLPAGIGYDAATNTTTATLQVTFAEIMLLNFRQTQRTSSSRIGTGITGVQLLRPISPGSSTSYRSDEMFDRHAKDAFSRFTALRFLTANFNTEREWSDRVRPTTPKSAWVDRAGVWEHQVMLANETGKDLYITIPINASEDYVRRLARLIAFGSDGNNPYSGPVTHPAFPGLNSNLRVYVEWGNEVWNWAFSQATVGANAGRDAVRYNTPDGRIINFDGKRPDGDFRRWHALRTVRASDVFRQTFGNEAMGERVRVLLEYQYDNQQDTALESLKFIDSYFNNADGVQHVADPKPVNYYIWGAGGATYFSASNPRGLTNDIRVWGGEFEEGWAPAGKSTVRPSGTAWWFTSTAGIYRDAGWAKDGQTGWVESLGTVPAANGAQAMYIAGDGSANVVITFPRAGVYAIDFMAGGKSDGMGANSLDFYLDGERVTPRGAGLHVNPGTWRPGEYGKSSDRLENYGTVPIWVSGPGTRTLKIVGRGRGDQVTVIDDVKVASLDAIYASQLPGGGQAAGQVSGMDYPKQLADQARWAQAYGLEVVAYEGGWSLGGDFNALPIMNYAKYRDSRTVQVQVDALNAFSRAGGALNVLGTYDQWLRSDTDAHNDYSIIKGIDRVLDGLAAEPNMGTAVPGTLWPVNRTADSSNMRDTSGQLRAGEWLSWTVTVPQTGDYRISISTGGGGRVSLIVDGNEVAEGGSGGSLSDTVRLTKGVHSIRVHASGGRFAVNSSNVAYVGNNPQTSASAPPVTQPTPTPSAPVSSTSIPSGWRGENIGADQAGSFRMENGKWVVSGAGANIWGSTDEFYFANSSIDGDTVLTTRIDWQQATHAGAKAGVMIRSGSGTSAAFAGVFQTPDWGIVFQWRNRYRNAPSEIYVPNVSGPVWLRLVRRGNAFSAFYSTNGSQWTRIGVSESILMPNSAIAGLAVTSRDPNRTSTAVFSNVSLT